jgi:hypothetical protein
VPVLPPLLLRRHALPQDFVDAGQMTFAFRPEPLEDIGVYPDGRQFLDRPEKLIPSHGGCPSVLWKRFRLGIFVQTAIPLLIQSAGFRVDLNSLPRTDWRTFFVHIDLPLSPKRFGLARGRRRNDPRIPSGAKLPYQHDRGRGTELRLRTRDPQHDQVWIEEYLFRRFEADAMLPEIALRFLRVPDEFDFQSFFVVATMS